MYEIEWTVRPSCVYNSGVECEKRNACNKCGWRPDVAARRVGEIRKAAREAAEAVRRERVLVIGGVCV